MTTEHNEETTSPTPQGDSTCTDSNAAVTVKSKLEGANTPFLSGLARLERVLIKGIQASTIFMIIALGFLMALQVFMRYVLESPFLGIEELAPLFALWVYFLGMANATRQRTHIAGGVVNLIFKKPLTKTIISAINTLLCLGVTCVFSYYAYKFAMVNLNIGRMSTYMRLPKYLWDFSMFTGFSLMAGYFFLQWIFEIQKILCLKSNPAEKRQCTQP